MKRQVIQNSSNTNSSNNSDSCEKVATMVITISKKCVINLGNYENTTLGISVEMPVPVNLNLDLVEKLKIFQASCVQIAKSVQDQMDLQVSEFRI